MNPIYDLIVIGMIVVMVFLNLYHSRVPSQQTNSFLSTLRGKFTAFDLLGQKTPVHHHGPASVSLK